MTKKVKIHIQIKLTITFHMIDAIMAWNKYLIFTFFRSIPEYYLILYWRTAAA